MIVHGATQLSNSFNQIAIETTQLSRQFGTQLAVDSLSLRVPAGSIFGFLGPNGAGKTTTIRMLTGLIQPSAGSAYVGGLPLGQQNDAIRRAVGLLTETPGLYEKLTPLQNLTFFAQLYGLDAQEAQKRAEFYLQRFDLWERRNDLVGGFSKGMRQKVAITRALLHDPAILFLDEPTAGLDPEAARIVRDLVRMLQDEGRTIFLTTHNLQEVEELCDIIAVFRTRLIALGTPTELRDRLFGRGTVIELQGDAAQWLGLVTGLPGVRSVAAEGNTLRIVLEQPEQQNPQILNALVQAGAAIRYVLPLAHSLEQVYLELVAAQGSTP
jgi:ABC-2 type transport system ATP-binding protein